MDVNTDTEAGQIAALAMRGAESRVISAPDGRQFLLIPPGVVAKEITDPHGLVLTPPGRLQQDVTVQTVDSLVDYVNRFKTVDTVLFADMDANSIVVALDYHQADGVNGAAHKAAFNEHRVTMQLPFSIEWQTWMAADGKLVPQLEFARFLEENAVDVIAPSGADLLEVCKDIQAVRNVDFRKAVRTNSDNENFEYEDTTDARTRNGSLEIPTKFELRLPVYFGDPTQALHAFLRWKVQGNELLLGVKLHRAEHLRQAVFRERMMEISERTERPAVFGKLA